jgi:hypothetical protein
MAEHLAASDNIFLIVESEPSQKVVNELYSHAQAVYHFPVKKSGEQEFNVFSLTDALGKRDKKTLWVQFHKARRAGKEPEELHGILFWQVKSMILASSHANAKEAGMKDFPFKKAKEFAGNYTNEELFDLSEKLVTYFHEARRGQGDIATNLERCILEM